MISAFGVEHGEVSKAIGMPKLPGMPKIGGALSSLGSKVGAGTSALGRKAGAFGGSQLKQGRLKTAGVGGSAGNRLRAAGGAMARNPMATGTGIAAGGAGVAGGAAMAHTPNSKKLTQYR